MNLPQIREKTIFAAKDRKEHKKEEDKRMTTFELCDRIRQIAYEIHVYHGHGHLEKVYENALAHRLRKAGIRVEQQFPLDVYDEDGTLLGNYFADLFVDERLVVELKATRILLDSHTAQLIGYLKSSRIEHGLLINFGSYKFEVQKKIFTQGNARNL